MVFHAGAGELTEADSCLPARDRLIPICLASRARVAMIIIGRVWLGAEGTGMAWAPRPIHAQPRAIVAVAILGLVASGLPTVHSAPVPIEPSTPLAWSSNLSRPVTDARFPGNDAPLDRPIVPGSLADRLIETESEGPFEEAPDQQPESCTAIGLTRAVSTRRLSASDRAPSWPLSDSWTTRPFAQRRPGRDPMSVGSSTHALVDLPTLLCRYAC